ncbi:MAG: type II secretion system protein GspM [Alphaproteobacteria bacterium]
MRLLAYKERLVALALLALAILAAQGMVVAPLVALYDAREKHLDMLTTRAMRVAIQRGSSEETQRRLAALESSGEARAIFWPGTTEAVATAALQEQMRTLLTQSGADVETTEALPSVPDGALARIALRLRFSADIDQLSRVIHSVEAARPALIIERVAVRAQNSTRVDAPALAVELQLFGFAEPGVESGRKT